MIEKIVAYFEFLASAHPDILHSQTNKRFVFAGLAQFLDSQTDLELQNFCIIFTWSDVDKEFKQNQTFNIYNLGIKFLKNCEAGNYSEQVKIQSKALEIAEDFLDQLIRDIGNNENGVPFHYTEFSEVNIIGDFEQVNTNAVGVLMSLKVKKYHEPRTVAWQI